MFPPFLNLLYVHDISNYAYFVHIRRRIKSNWCVQKLVFNMSLNKRKTTCVYLALDMNMLYHATSLSQISPSILIILLSLQLLCFSLMCAVRGKSQAALPFQSLLISYRLRCAPPEFSSPPPPPLLIFDSIQKKSVWPRAGAAVLLSLQTGTSKSL